MAIIKLEIVSTRDTYILEFKSKSSFQNLKDYDCIVFSPEISIIDALTVIKELPDKNLFIKPGAILDQYSLVVTKNLKIQHHLVLPETLTVEGATTILKHYNANYLLLSNTQKANTAEYIAQNLPSNCIMQTICSFLTLKKPIQQNTLLKTFQATVR